MTHFIQETQREMKFAFVNASKEINGDLINPKYYGNDTFKLSLGTLINYWTQSWEFFFLFSTSF